MLLAALFVTPTTSATAQDLVYEPTNPAFGGSPVNYRWLLNSANQQNPYDEGPQVGGFRDEPLDDFQQQLQRRVLDQLSRELIEQRFGDVDLTERGSFDFEQFRVEVRPGPGAIRVQIFDKQSGETSTVEIPRF